MISRSGDNLHHLRDDIDTINAFIPGLPVSL